MKKTKWMLYAKRADFKAIADRYGIDQVTARIIRNRDVITDEQIRSYLYGTEEDLYDPSLMRDACRAASILKEKIREGKKIRIIGDYDIDGVCAVAILYRVLSGLGAVVDYEIPDRITDGYGLKRRLVEYAIEEQVDTILTCDNGIRAVDEIRFAKESGMTVIVTDHHQPGPKLPPADAVLDPCRKDETYPFSGICGAVVAWKLMQVLTGDMLLSYLDLAAFATVGDVMDLQNENRIIVRLGLSTLRNTDRIGLKALIEENALTGKEIKAYHIGFILGPCINAGGRIDTAKRSLALLLSEDPAEASELASELVRLNVIRRELTEEGLERAIRILEGDGENGPDEVIPDEVRLTTPEDKVLVVYLPDCHESVAGIIAGKLRERYYRPSIVLTDAQEPGIVKGSARSIEGYHMHDALEESSDLLLAFGGHPMAAGLSLQKANLARFARFLNEHCTLTGDALIQKQLIDVPVPMYYLNEKLIREFDLLEPFGKGNEKPVFALKNVSLSGGKILGSSGNTFKCMIEDETGTRLEGIWYGNTSELILEFWERWGREQTGRLMRGQENTICAAVLYYPQINHYRGWTNIQLRILSFA